MEPLEFGKFIVRLLESFWDRFAFITECKKGNAIIKTRFGHPIKWRNKTGWYWKWPVFDMFDIVDVRKKYVQFNAHSFHASGMEKSLFPYNIIIDFQVEYQVVNPLVIYNEYGFAQGESEYLSYINNTVQNEISKLIVERNIDISYSDIINHFNDARIKLCIQNKSFEDSKEFDVSYCKSKKENKSENIKAEECISINDIVVTSFDKNISIRSTV